MTIQAVIYSKDNCIFCTRAKELLVKNNISYRELIIDVMGRDDRILAENQAWTTRDELLQARPGVKTVPQIWLDDVHIGGYSDLVAKLNL